MRISEEFFGRLLASTDAGDAVATLSGCWANRMRAEAPQFGLAFSEWQVQLILIYTGEVWNGGHMQYVINRGTGLGPATGTASQAVGLRDHAEVLHVLETAGWSEAACAQADASFDAAPGDVDGALLAHLRSHASEVLLPERGRRGT